MSATARHRRRPLRDLRGHGGGGDAARYRVPGRVEDHIYLYPLALGAVSILASVVGTFFARIGRGENAIINALYKAVIVATVLSAILFIPVTKAFENGAFTFWDLYLSALTGLVVTFLLVAITEFYTGTRWNPVKSIAKASQTGHATNIIEGLAVGMQATALPVIVLATGILCANHFAGLFGIGVAVMAQLSMTGLIVALDATAGHRQRWGHRRDGRSAGERPRDYRSPRRGRQHHQGRDQGLRDRLGRARGARPVRLVHDGADRRGTAGCTSTRRSRSACPIHG